MKVSHSGGLMIFQYIYYNANVGVYPFNDHHFIQFVVWAHKKKGYELGFNVYHESGSFVAYQCLRQYDNSPLLDVRVIGCAGANQYFLAEDVDEVPVVKMIRIEAL